MITISFIGDIGIKKQGFGQLQGINKSPMPGMSMRDVKLT